MKAFNIVNIKVGILFFCSMGVSGLSFGQLQEIETSKANWITLGEIKWLGNSKASLKYLVNKEDTSYLLLMQDEEKLKNSRDKSVTKLFSIRFSGQNNTVGKLYDLLAAFFTDENRKNKKLEKIFTLGTEMIHVQHYSKLTGHTIMFSTKENHILFSQNELRKLFGK